MSNKIFFGGLFIFLISFAVGIGFITSLQRVEAGHVGIKVYLLGGQKGVDNEVLGVGRYWIGFNEELFLFPTFQQTKTWTRSNNEGSTNDDSFTFQTKDGLSINADISVSYAIDPEKVSLLFQKYRKGVDEITNIYLRNVIRDTLVQVSSTCSDEYIYGEGKSQLIKEVEELVSMKMRESGIIIEYIAFVGALRLPKNVVESINLKIEAKQRAQQRENELQETVAIAEKNKAEANGTAQANIIKAKGEADAILIRANAQSKSNELINQSLTDELIEYFKIEKWNGIMPQYYGGTTPIIDLRHK